LDAGLAAFIGISLLLAVTPGPDMAVVTKNALAHGRRGVVLTTTGIALALAASRLIGSLLFGIAPSDPVAMGSALAVLIGVALVASYVPARRASRLDPTRALRYE